MDKLYVIIKTQESNRLQKKINKSMRNKQGGMVMILGSGKWRTASMDYSPRLQKMLEYCRNTDVSGMTEGRYDVFPGEDIIVLINERVTEPKENRMPEVHRHYVELHYVVSGEEYIGYYPDRNDNEVKMDCMEEKDTLYYRENPAEEELMVPLRKDDYAIFFPEDVHRPFCKIGRSGPIKKIVIKIPVCDC